ncbi:MAG: acyl carrier protein [Byssovorax sp.]|jgi:acyl carrier protein
MSRSWQPLAEYIQENLSTDPAQPIAEDTPLLSSGLIESFSLVQLVVHVEVAYGIKIAAAFRTEEHFDSVGQIVALAERLAAKK